MTRQIPVLALCALAAISVSARSLTPDEALDRLGQASVRMRMAGVQKSDPLRLAYTETTEDGSPAVYIFNNADAEGGYVVVGADDVAQPLLGYSDGGNISPEDMPEQLKWWLGQYAAEIEYAQTHDVPVVLDAGQWRASDSRQPVAPLCSTRWDQGSPYNQQCPMVSGKRSVTGCLATAMAQVMKYHSWPEKGTGSITYTDGNTQRSMNFNVTFDWANMLDTYTTTATSTQKNAVALLMKACGYSVLMSYSATSSGASDVYVVPALTTYFDYDGGVRTLDRACYGLADWQQMIYDNISQIGPVLYCGQAVGGGHAFVCDGYSSDGYFHFNWGWSGMYDGYFQLTALNPEGQGIGGFAGGYNYTQSATLGIQKPTGQAVSAPVRLTQHETPSGTIYAGSLSLNGGWYNMTGAAMNCAIGIRFEPVNGTAGTTKYVSLTSVQLEPLTGYSSLSVNLSSNIANGTYRVSVVTRSASAGYNDPWLPAIHPINQPDYVTVTRSGTSYDIVNPTAGRLVVSDVRLLTELYNGCAAKIRFTVTNPSEYEVLAGVAPGLMSGTTLVATGAGEMFDLMPGETVTRDMVFDWTYYSGFKLNTSYELCLYNREDMSVYGTYGKVSVAAKPSTSLACTSFVLEGNTSAVDRNNMHFTADVTCRSGYFAEPLYVLITEVSGGTVLQSATSSEMLFIESGDNAKAEFHVSYPDAVAGSTYRANLAYLNNNSWTVLDYIDFKISATGIETVSASANGPNISYDAATGVIEIVSDTDISVVTVTDVVGRAVAVEVEYDGCKATVDVAGTASGVMIVTAADDSGAVRSMKLAR